MFTRNLFIILILSWISQPFLFSQGIEIFRIDNSKNQTITAKRGGALFIPAKSFVDSNGRTETQVMIRIQEIIDNEDLLNNGIATTDSLNILVTGGIIYFDAFGPNNTPLHVNPKSAIIIQTPADNIVPTIQVATSSFTYDNQLLREMGIGGTIPVPEFWRRVEYPLEIVEPGKLIKVKSQGGVSVPEDQKMSIKAGYAVAVPKTGWFMLYNNLQDVTLSNEHFTFTVTLNKPDAQILMVPRKYSSLIKPKKINKNAYKFEQIPMEEEYIIIAFMVSGNKYYYAQKIIWLKSKDRPKNLIKLELEQVSLEYLRAALSSI